MAITCMRDCNRGASVDDKKNVNICKHTDENKEQRLHNHHLCVVHAHACSLLVVNLTKGSEFVYISVATCEKGYDRKGKGEDKGKELHPQSGHKSCV